MNKRRKMIILGLTGSIGMGKSTAAKILRDMGYPVHDADASVHALMEPDGEAFDEIAAAFPLAVRNGKIDRQKLGQIVFYDNKKLEKLEKILHPKVRMKTDQFLLKAEQDGHKIVILDIPLLYETAGEKRVDAVMVVTAPYDVQKARVLARHGMTDVKFKQILERQIPDEIKRKKADFVIEMIHGEEQARHDLAALMEKALKIRPRRWAQIKKNLSP